MKKVGGGNNKGGGGGGGRRRVTSHWCAYRGLPGAMSWCQQLQRVHVVNLRVPSTGHQRAVRFVHHYQINYLYYSFLHSLLRNKTSIKNVWRQSNLLPPQPFLVPTRAPFLPLKKMSRLTCSSSPPAGDTSISTMSASSEITTSD